MPGMPQARHKGAPPTEPFEEIMLKAQDALDRGDLTLAEKHFGQATVVRPASPEAWYGKGRAFSRQEEWEKALRCFSIATKFAPKFANAWAGLAAAHLQMGEKDKARAALARAAELGADHVMVGELRKALA